MALYTWIVAFVSDMLPSAGALLALLCILGVIVITSLILILRRLRRPSRPSDRPFDQVDPWVQSGRRLEDQDGPD